MEELRTSDEVVKRGFNEEEQAAIIARAAALQRDHGQLSTLSDLERAALEAGIEPRFVREAVRLQHDPLVEAAIVPTGKSNDHIWRSVMSAVIFVPFEIVALSYTRELLPSGWGALVIAVLFGLALPRRPYARWLAVAWPVFVGMSIIVFDPHSEPGRALVFSAVQAAVALAVNVVADPRARGNLHALAPAERRDANDG